MIEMKPCSQETCAYYRPWYRTGTQLFQKAGDAPGLADTRDFCRFCSNFNGFNLFTPRLSQGHGDKDEASSTETG